jgi:DNA-binding NtrC family response regulator
MVAPLRRGDHVLGAIYCDKAVSGSTFTPRDLELLAGFAGQVALILENARFAEALRRPSRFAPRASGAPATFADLGTRLPALENGLRAISEAAAGGGPVLVTGEPGTGKRTLAGAIHRGSPRAGGPLVIVDAASLPREALERELFGSDEAPGRIDEAAGGTLLIAEIGELPVPAQIRVDAFLTRGAVRRGGAEVHLDVRLVATATRDLGPRFRRELRDRLYVTHLELPPLRERTADLPQLTQRILTRLGGTIVGTSAEVLEALAAHSWPGNLRELEQVLLAEVNAAPPGLELLVEVPATLAVAQDPGRGVRSLVETEHRLLVSALRQHRGNVPSVARALGVSRGTVYNMMRKFRVDPGGFRGPTQT